MEQSSERSSALPIHLGLVAIEKGAFWAPSTTGANFTFMILSNPFYLIIIICSHSYLALFLFNTTNFLTNGILICTATPSQSWPRINGKGYSILPRRSELEPHHQMQFSLIHRTQRIENPADWAGNFVSIWGRCEKQSRVVSFERPGSGLPSPLNSQHKEKNFKHGTKHWPYTNNWP